MGTSWSKPTSVQTPSSKRRKVAGSVSKPKSLGLSASSSSSLTSASPSASRSIRQTVSASAASASSGAVCVQCNCPVEGQFVRAMGNIYHADHFRCEVCLQPIRSTRFFHLEGKPYCQADYDKFINPEKPSCAVCNERIVEGPSFEAGRNSYHHHCFACCMCSASLKAGEQYYISRKRGSDNNKRLHLVCSWCHSKRPTSATNAAVSSSGDSTTTAADAASVASITCHTVSTAADNTIATTTVKSSSSIASEGGEMAMASMVCAACKESIDDAVLRSDDNLFHVHCFKCSVCKTPFGLGKTSPLGVSFLSARNNFSYRTSFSGKHWMDSDGQYYCRTHCPYALLSEQELTRHEEEREALSRRNADDETELHQDGAGDNGENGHFAEEEAKADELPDGRPHVQSNGALPSVEDGVRADAAGDEEEQEQEAAMSDVDAVSDGGNGVASHTGFSNGTNGTSHTGSRSDPADCKLKVDSGAESFVDAATDNADASAAIGVDTNTQTDFN